MGGELTKTGNFARFGANQTGDTTCTRTHGAVSAATTTTPEVSVTVKGRVITIQEPRGATEAAVAFGHGAVSAAQAGIGLATTGSPLIPLSALTVMLLIGGFLVKRLRLVA